MDAAVVIIGVVLTGEASLSGVNVAGRHPFRSVRRHYH